MAYDIVAKSALAHHTLYTGERSGELSVSILSYKAFFVGTSILPSRPAQYTSSGTDISPVKVQPDRFAFSVSSSFIAHWTVVAAIFQAGVLVTCVAV